MWHYLPASNMLDFCYLHYLPSSRSVFAHTGLFVTPVQYKFFIIMPQTVMIVGWKSGGGGTCFLAPSYMCWQPKYGWIFCSSIWLPLNSHLYRSSDWVWCQFCSSGYIEDAYTQKGKVSGLRPSEEVLQMQWVAAPLEYSLCIGCQVKGHGACDPTKPC